MLTIFKKQADSELYERIEEAHYQRAYSIDRLCQLLEANGLSMVDCFDADMKTQRSKQFKFFEHVLEQLNLK